MQIVSTFMSKHDPSVAVEMSTDCTTKSPQVEPGNYKALRLSDDFFLSPCDGNRFEIACCSYTIPKTCSTLTEPCKVLANFDVNSDDKS